MKPPIALNSSHAPRGFLIGNVFINQDEHGRYRLNDLHIASGAPQSKKPGKWMQNQEAIDLIAVMSKCGNRHLEQNQSLVVIHGGSQQGTYAIDKIMIAYATWISPEFFNQVIDTYLAAKTVQPHGMIPIETYYRQQERLDEVQTKYIAMLEQQPTARETSAAHKWTPEEDRQAIECRLQGLSYGQIGKRLNRTGDAVRHRFERALKTEMAGMAVNTASPAASVNADEVWC